MDSGHSPGDRRPGRGQQPGRPDGQDDRAGGGRADEAWRPIRPSKRVDRGGDWLYQSEESGDPADFSVSEYRERLLGGPGSELYGSHGSRSANDAPLRDSPDFDSGYHVPYAEQSLSGRNDFARDLDRYEDRYDDRYDDSHYGDYGDEYYGYEGGGYDSGYRAARGGYNTGEFRPGDFGTGQFRAVGGGEGRLTPSPVPRQASNDSFGAERINLGGSGPIPEETPAESSGLVRPYFRTKGRTRPSQDLAIETLISTSERGRRLDGVRVPEHKSICGLCLDTRSVAEVAALLKMPLGVVRVLVGDVAGLGLVLVHSPNTNAMVGDRPSIEFMERVLSGLRRI